jgi:hypothetical protein
MKRHPVLMALVGATLFGSALLGAADVADFYRGKRINFVIGYGTGGGYDIYCRLLARFIGEHIPGNPTVVPQNMPGAGSRRAANWLYSVAPKDGTVLACLGQATPTDQALGQPGIQFERANSAGSAILWWSITSCSYQPRRCRDDRRRQENTVHWRGEASSPHCSIQISNHLLGTKFRLCPAIPAAGTSTSPWSGTT